MVTIKSVEELFGTLQQSIVAEWRKHLKTSKYSKHMALDEFYKEMPELVDSLIENYMGHNKEKVGDYVNVLKAEDYDALQYLEALHDVCDQGRKLLGDVPELESDLDAIVSMIDGVAYKVRELGENRIIATRNLSDILTESMADNAKVAHHSINTRLSLINKKAKSLTKNKDEWKQLFKALQEYDDIIGNALDDELTVKFVSNGDLELTDTSNVTYFWDSDDEELINK